MKQSLILIVDDDHAIRETLEALIAGQDYKIIFASDGLEGLQMARAHMPDLILLDIMMPEMDGFEACSLIRKEKLLAEVPIIIVTALDDRISRLKGIEAGADEFITKPYDGLELRTRIKTILRLNRYRQLLQERVKFEWITEKAEDGYVIINNRDEILYANNTAKCYLGLEEYDVNFPETFINIAGNQYFFKPDDGWHQWPNNIKMERYLLRPESENSDPFWIKVEILDLFSKDENNYLLHLKNVTDKIVSRRNTWTFNNLVDHKLRTPLCTLTGIIEFLNQDPAMFPADELSDLISDAHRSAVRIKEQILTVLHSIDAKALINPVKPVCSGERIIKIINEIANSMELEDFQLHYDENLKDMNAPLSHVSVEMILRELFMNSIKFHPINLPVIEINMSASENELQIKFIDNGIHLSPEQLKNMWHPYYQGERYFTGEVKGMGLGLPTISSIIWSAGGNCRSYNRKDAPGLVIEFLLPKIL